MPSRVSASPFINSNSGQELLCCTLPPLPWAALSLSIKQIYRYTEVLTAKSVGDAKEERVSQKWWISNLCTPHNKWYVVWSEHWNFEDPINSRLLIRMHLNKINQQFFGHPYTEKSWLRAIFTAIWRFLGMHLGFMIPNQNDFQVYNAINCLAFDAQTQKHKQKQMLYFLKASKHRSNFVSQQVVIRNNPVLIGNTFHFPFVVFSLAQRPWKVSGEANSKCGLEQKC